MPEPTFGHQPCKSCRAPAESGDECDRCFFGPLRPVGQPDDPGQYARSCLRCGLDEGLGENRLCATCCPPAPWWASILRTVDERALLLRLWRGVRRFMARCAGEGT